MPNQYMGFNEFAPIFVDLMKKNYGELYYDIDALIFNIDTINILEQWENNFKLQPKNEVDEKTFKLFEQIAQAFADTESMEAKSFRNMFYAVRSPYIKIRSASTTTMDETLLEIESLLRIARNKVKECPEVIYELLSNIDIYSLKNIKKNDMVKEILNQMIDSPVFAPKDAKKPLDFNYIETNDDYIQYIRHLDASFSKIITEEESKEFPNMKKLSEYYDSMNKVFSTILEKLDKSYDDYSEVRKLINDLKPKYSPLGANVTMKQYEKTIEEKNRILEEKIAELEKRISEKSQDKEYTEQRLRAAIDNFNNRKLDAFRGNKLKEEVEHIIRR